MSDPEKPASPNDAKPADAAKADGKTDKAAARRAAPERKPAANKKATKKAAAPKKTGKTRRKRSGRPAKGTRKPSKKVAAKKSRPTRRGKKPGRKPKGYVDVAAIRAKLGLSRAELAKEVGVHLNSVANWEHGSSITEQNVAKLKKLSKGGARAIKAAKSATDGAVDVVALRKKLGMSRNAFAKKLGVSSGSVYNWEHGTTTPYAKHLTALRELAGQPTKNVAEPVSRPGRRPGRPRGSVRIVGEVPVVYANAVAVTRQGDMVRLRFGLAVPGESGARVVADVVVSGRVLDRNDGRRAQPL